ncbi:hypothetical protein KAW18_02060 [candidate division WOR-3 bacterium]|nr:hypothetical protein [candidate division WOR-3 bacterium]
MKIEKFEIERKEPFAIVELNGKGCGFGGCNCLPYNIGDADNFISISNGGFGLCISLTDEEAKEIKDKGVLGLWTG